MAIRGVLRGFVNGSSAYDLPVNKRAQQAVSEHKATYAQFLTLLQLAAPSQRLADPERDRHANDRHADAGHVLADILIVADPALYEHEHRAHSHGTKTRLDRESTDGDADGDPELQRPFTA